MSTATRQTESSPPGAALPARARLRTVCFGLLLAAALLVPAAATAQEPTTQPANILRFDPDATDPNPELQISWTAGNGEGTLVLMRQGLPVAADPVDGTSYTANAAFGLGDELGSAPDDGNFVVFVGTGTLVTVTGLQSDVPYFLAFYSYNAPGGVFDYLTVSPPERASGHNSSHTIDCAECHFNPAAGSAHGGFGVPRGTEQETVCKTCHNPSSVASDKSAVDIHTGPNYSTIVDCGSCHEIHNSDTLISVDAHTGGATAANRQWIRSDTAKYIAGAQEDALFQGRCTGDGTTVCNGDPDCLPTPGGTCSSTDFFAFGDSDSPWNGLCQSCHTLTGSALSPQEHRHTNDTPAGGPFPLNHAHETGASCTTCHTHQGQQGTDDGFTPQGGGCLGCHNTAREISASPGTFRRQVVEGSSSRCTGDPAIVCTTDAECGGQGSCTNGEFGVDFTSHHVNDGTGAEIVTEWDCVVCHAEGDVLTGSADGTYHQKDGVQLKHVDSGSVYADWPTLTPQQRSEFCLSCHDANGAQNVIARTDPDPDATTDNLNPFNDLVANAHEPNGFQNYCEDLRTVCARARDCSGIGGGACIDFDVAPVSAPHSRGRCSTTDVIACGTAYECPVGETCDFLQVVNVKDQFDGANTSHHALEEVGPAYSATPHGSNVDNAIQGARTDLGWESVLNCEDCHYGSATNKLQGHGTANARYMLRDKAGNDTLPTPLDTGNLNTNCFRCHIPTGDPADYDSTQSAYPAHGQAQHVDDNRNIFGILCLNCHGGGEFGAIHGIDGLVTDDNGGGSYNPNAFTWGSSLDRISNWTPSASVSCSTRNDFTLLSNCTQHTPSRDYDRGEVRIYRDP
jgi:hypothetical protein